MSWTNSFKKHQSGVSGIINLGFAILESSCTCMQEFKGLIDEKFGKGSKEALFHWIQVQYEFLFFFAHLAMRRAFARLGAENRDKLQNLLGPILADNTTEAWFGHWPAKRKEGIKSNFFNNINVAELEYSKYKKLMPGKDENLKDTLFWEFSHNIARLSGYENDQDIIMKCMDASVKQITDMKLDELVDSVIKDIKLHDDLFS